MNRKIAMSLISSAAMVALVVGATFAFFSDSGTSSGNVFATGTLDLRLSDNAVNGGGAESVVDSVTSSFGSNTLVPGTCTGPQTLNLRNSGTIAANHAEVTVSNVPTDANGNASPDMDSFLRINALTYDAVDVTGQLTDQGGDGNVYLDLADWAADAGDLDNLALTNLNTDHPLVMDVCLDSSAGDTLQGDSVTSTFTVTLNQVASQ